MAILNYTTTISVEKTIVEIEKMLGSSGASKIIKDYDAEGNIDSISFIIDYDQGKLPFKLPMKVDAVLQTLKNQSGEYTQSKRRIIPLSKVNIDQARRVGWRIIKDWLEAQLALYFLQMVKIEEIFLPYMYSERMDKTMFQMLEDKGFNNLIEDKSKDYQRKYVEE